MLRRLLPAVLTLALLALPLPVAALDYTDIWFLLSESGWGINLIQNEDVIFATFFIYGPNNQPTWYYATMYRDSNGNFSGNLYSTVGSYYGAPWDPSLIASKLVGTASFFPSNPYQGTLTYIVSGGPTVTKTIQRQTLKTIALGGNYTGGQVGNYTGNNCSIAGKYQDPFNVTVTQLSDGTVTFAFTYFNSGIDCNLSGTLVQQGQLYSISNAAYVCSGGATVNTTATMDAIKATAQGIEGTFSAPSIGNGCGETGRFSGAQY